MKKQYLLITFLLAITMNSFSAEWSPLQFREHPRSPEDHVENFLCRLNCNLTPNSDWTLDDVDSDKYQWVLNSVKWAQKDIKPLAGRSWWYWGGEKDLAHLLRTPSDEHRMNYLEQQLRKIIAELSCDNRPEGTIHTYKSDIHKLLTEFLKTKEQVMAQLQEQRHTALTAQAKVLQESTLDKATQTDLTFPPITLQNTLSAPATQKRLDRGDPECCIL